MEEKNLEINQQEGNPQEKTPEQERLEKLNEVVQDIIIEYKKRGSITTDALYDKLEKYEASPMELEEIYKTFFHQHHGRKSTGLDSYGSSFDIRSNYLLVIRFWPIHLL